MQESFGGTFLIKLFMIFFIIYVTFLGIALNFAKTYRIKNAVINILEQYQYEYKGNNTEVFEKIDSYLAQVPYTISYELATNQCKRHGVEYDVRGGVCIIPEGDANARYYRVEVYYSVIFPFFKFGITIPIAGETRIISVK